MSADVRFRPPGASDLEVVHRLHGDPATNAHNPFGASPDRAASAALLAQWMSHSAAHGFGYELAVVDGDVVGVCGARHDRWQGRGVINLYWRLLPEHWGRGWSAPLAVEALRVGRSRPAGGREPIVARMLPDNVASRRVAERVGLVRAEAWDGVDAGVRWILFADPDPVSSRASASCGRDAASPRSRGSID